MPTTDLAAGLASRLRGSVLEPGDSSYDQARKVFNAMIDRKPRLIAKCVDAADVMTCVRYGHENKLRVAIRGGGHNAGGLGICDDGLVIDLSGIKYVHVDASARTVRVGGGCVWGDVDHATHAFGLAVPTGIISTTGVGGLTLGGGIGHLTRQCGLTIDNLLSADVVLADGRTVTASANENEDLFWALRGGGGNFGVATSFLFHAHPIHTPIAGPMFWDISRAAEMMQWYREFMKTIPDDLNGFFAYHVIPPGPPFPEPWHMKKMCGVIWSYTGPHDKSAEVFEPIRKMKPDVDLVGPIPLPVLQSLFDPLYAPGLQCYWKAHFVKELPDAAIAAHAKAGEGMPTLLSGSHLYPISGAAHRIGADETAWGYRDANWAHVIIGVDADPANRETITSWARNYFDETKPYSAAGAYSNFMMSDEGDERVRASYGQNYDRLASVKAKYDPGNFFNVNQNIRPRATAA
jgi:FAD/FMN-containing dehydrogenase